MRGWRRIGGLKHWPRVAPGIADIAAASLATFATGLFAARYLEARLLGVYALFFITFQLAAEVPSRLVLVPGEVKLLDVPKVQRNQGFRVTLRFGVPMAFAAASLTMLAWIPGISSATAAEIGPVAATACVLSFLSPIQDHIRRLQHLAGISRIAALMSIVQLVAVTAALMIALGRDIDPLWVPFGALSVANAFSLAVGIAVSSRNGEPPEHFDLRYRELLRSGRWLLAMTLIPRVAEFGAGFLVAVLAGSTYLGFAEAARIVARPLHVVIDGIAVVINPLAMEAGRNREPETGARFTRLATVAVPALALLMLLVVGINWSVNPLAPLIRNAYEVPGLVAVTILANAASGMLISQRAQLIGGGREAGLTGVEAMGSILLVVVALSAGVTHSFAIPLGLLALYAARWIGYRTALRNLYS